MTALDTKTTEELHEDIRLWWGGIEGAVRGKCYQVNSIIGIRGLVSLVRRHLAHIDRLLAEIEHRAK